MAMALALAMVMALALARAMLGTGTVLHTWHGKKADRKYYDRWQILVTNDYQPYHDLKKNSYGLFQLNDDGTERFVRLRDQLRGYFRVRNEDSIDLI